MGAMASQITSLTQPFIEGAVQTKHQSSASLAFERGIHRWLVNSLHKGPVTRKMFPFDDVIMGPSVAFPAVCLAGPIIYWGFLACIEFEINCSASWPRPVAVPLHKQTGKFHQPRLLIRTFHHQERCSRGGHLCNEHSEEKYSCSYK